MEKVCCIYCKKEYSIRGIFTHVDRAHLGSTKYSSGNNGSYQKLSNDAKDRHAILEKEYNVNPNKCKECNAIMPYINKNNKFCNNICSAKHYNSLRKENGWVRSYESKKKLSEKISGREYIKGMLLTQKCKNCENNFTYVGNNKLRTFCSTSCGSYYHAKLRREELRNIKTDFENYKMDTKFKFNLADYPNEFNFELIKKYGWYKAKNRGDNLNGVSRDHMISVKYGFENNIPAHIIAHPANCELLQHNDNISKYKKCSLTLEELVYRIEMWDLIYKS